MLSFASFGQIDSLIVERYYVAGGKDTLNFDLAEPLQNGSVTYRIFVDLAEGSQLLEIFGNEDHPFIISSTEAFFNNTFRNQSFGYRNNERSFAYNTVALDTWITLGLGTRNHIGVLKTDDSDGSLPEISENENGVLKNEDPDAGIPVSISDGYIPADTLPAFSHTGIFDILTGQDSTIFGINYGKTFFYSEEFSLRENSQTGIMGPEPYNRVLICQLTTRGELSFSMNLRIRDASGDIYNYFGKDTIIDMDNNERFSSWLTYPFNLVKGCMDPWYSEFNPDAVIDDGSCRDSVIFGCLDINACNYDATANVHLDELCCYDSNCELDLDEVCPGTIYGCMDPEAVNYNPAANATSSINGCCYVQGCMDERYLEYNSNACHQDSTDCKILIVEGCMDKSACNYNPVANKNTGCDYSCENENTKSFSLPGKHEKGKYSLFIYPSPVYDALTLDISLSNEANVDYEIIDLMGKIILKRQKMMTNGDHDLEIQLTDIRKGIYFIKIKVNDSISISKILKI